MEHPGRVQSGQRLLGRQQLAERPGRRSVLALEQQPLGRSAPPNVRIGEQRHQLGRRSLAQPRTHRLALMLLRHDPPDAALVLAGGQVRPVL